MDLVTVDKLLTTTSPSPTKNYALLRMTNRSKTFRNGGMTRFGLLRTWWKRLTISHYPTALRSTSTRFITGHTMTVDGGYVAP